MNSPVKSLMAMADEVYLFEESKGWQPNNNTFGDSLALLHSEISEALETFREIGFQERTLENGKPDDVASELADVLIRLLSTFHQFVPLADPMEQFERKMEYNRTRAFRHGNKAL